VTYGASEHVSLDGSELRSVVDTGYRYGWHPRIRPTPKE